MKLWLEVKTHFGSFGVEVSAMIDTSVDDIDEALNDLDKAFVAAQKTATKEAYPTAKEEKPLKELEEHSE
jgi:uncharacterized Ntn-hydrolase superfamily protein